MGPSLRFYFVLFIASYLVHFGMSLLLPPAYPRIHDEFSYLLAGDTFANGRLANPPHPMAEHFEAMHVLQHPKYASKYPPGQGIFLAVGILLGHPIIGVWFSLALAGTAMAWAMAPFAGRPWAAVCGMLFAFTMNCTSYVGQIGYWAQSYWGGAVACLGGALTLGALIRLSRSSNDELAIIQNEMMPTGNRFDRELVTRPTLWCSLFVLGLWLLAIARPFEGFLVAIPLSMGALFTWMRITKGRALSSRCKPLLIPVLLAITGGSWIGYYNARVTGNAFQMPYLSYEKQYSLTPMFLPQSLRAAPAYNNEPMRAFHVDYEAGIFREQESREGYVRTKLTYLTTLWEFFLGRGLSVLAILGVIINLARSRPTCDRSYRVLAIVSTIAFALVLAVHSQTVWMHPHYVAPLVPFLWCWMGIALAALASLKLFKFEIGLLLAISTLGFTILERSEEYDHTRNLFSTVRFWQHQRRSIEQELYAKEGMHLVLVEYGPDHSPHDEWCYNSADIDHSKIVWARDLGTIKNKELLEYFSNRVLHELKIDGGDPEFKNVGANHR